MLSLAGVQFGRSLVWPDASKVLLAQEYVGAELAYPSCKHSATLRAIHFGMSPHGG